MKKEEYEKLDKRVQEYIKHCVELGVINNENMNYMLDRLSRTKIVRVENVPYGGRTYSKNEDIIVEICYEKLEEEARELGRNIEEYIDENIFHELTHASSLDTNEIQNKISQFMEEPNVFPNILERGYDIINEYIAQSLAQTMVAAKYKKTYIKEHKKFVYNENGYLPENKSFSYEYDSDLFWYGELEEFAMKFIESVYGTRDVKNLYIDHFNGNVIDKAIEKYSHKKDGIHNLYKLFGNMSNIVVGDYYQQGYFGGNHNNNWSNIDVFVNSINDFNEIIEKTLNRGVGELE